jgi:hypothetical protein
MEDKEEDNNEKDGKASSQCTRYERKHHQTVKLEDTEIFRRTFPYLRSDILLERSNPLTAKIYCTDQANVPTVRLQRVFR